MHLTSIFFSIFQKQAHFNVLSMPIQQLYFGQGMGGLTLTQLVGISLITLSPLSKAGKAQPIKKFGFINVN